MKKVPMRQCLGCREMKPKKELIRVVKAPDGSISIDTKGKKPGRGAYICYDQSCLKKAIKSKAIERAFSSPISTEIYSQLESELAQSETENNG